MKEFIGEWFNTQTVLEETGQIEERKNVVEEDSDYYYEQNANV